MVLGSTSSSMVRMPARKRQDTIIYSTAVLTVLDLNDSVLASYSGKTLITELFPSDPLNFLQL